MHRPALLLTLAILLPAPALAQWRYDPAESMAVAYCAARAEGLNHKDAGRRATDAMADAAPIGLISGIGTVLSSGRATIARARYLASKICPEYYSATGPVTPQPAQEKIPEPKTAADGLEKI
jgi:hypothetical protein